MLVWDIQAWSVYSRSLMLFHPDADGLLNSFVEILKNVACVEHGTSQPGTVLNISSTTTCVGCHSISFNCNHLYQSSRRYQDAMVLCKII